MAHPLDSARLKVHRARGHLDALDIERKRFTDTNPFRLVVEPDLATGEDVVRFRCDEPIRVPLVLGLIAGDAIHNLRSALDHVIYQLALAGGGDGDRTQFPIFEDGHAYADHVGRLLEGVPEDERSKIKELQPFRARTLIEAGAAPPTTARDPLAVNMYLMFLGRLDNLDKHRLPLPGGVLVPFRQPSFEGVARA